MRFILLISFLLSTTLFGYNYNELLIKAQSSIFPKLLLLDKKIDQKLVDGEICYTIACETNDYHIAQALKAQMEDKYRRRLGEYPFKVEVILFSELTRDKPMTAIYALNSEEGIAKVSAIGKDLGILTFAYDMANLKDGILLSLMVEKSTILYLNKRTLPEYKVDFVDSLYQIVRFLDN